jgi:hypothetical protein
MKSLLIAFLFCFVTTAHSAVVATLPNQAGGKIVLTDEQCKHDGQVYTALRKAYNYGSTGNTSDGCWYLDDETVVVIWKQDNNQATTRRYPVENFDIRKRGKNL